jgi:hypothetical protein
MCEAGLKPCRDSEDKQMMRQGEISILGQFREYNETPNRRHFVTFVTFVARDTAFAFEPERNDCITIMGKPAWIQEARAALVTDIKTGAPVKAYLIVATLDTP